MKKTLTRSFACALRGLYVTFKSERNFRIHFVALCVAAALGFIQGLSAAEWGLIIFAAGFVLVAELFNTAVERLCDEASGGKRSETIRNAKDISSAAVLLAALTALLIGVFVLFIPLVRRLFE